MIMMIMPETHRENRHRADTLKGKLSAGARRAAALLCRRVRPCLRSSKAVSFSVNKGGIGEMPA